MSWKNCFSRVTLICAALLPFCSTVLAQQIPPETLQQILTRLDTLEHQNQDLLLEIRELRQQLTAQKAASNTAEPQQTELQQIKDEVAASREQVKEQAETKVGSSQRFPISLTGMFLFDSFYTNASDAYSYLPDWDDYSLGGSGGGATLNQSIIGLDFRGPQLPGGGSVHGSLSMDFYARNGAYDLFRIRRGTVAFDWRRRSLTVGQDKSIVAPLEPTSFARVGVPALAGSGNLWLWRPQITYEERIPFSDSTQATVQLSLLQTDEYYTAPTLPMNEEIEPSRPAIQARFGVKHTWSDDSRFAAGLAVHSSVSHVLGQSVNSRLISGDVLVRPLHWLELSGTIFHGENFANLGGASPGVTVIGESVIPIHGTGGWMQIAFPVTKRLTFDLYAGAQHNRDQDLGAYALGQTLTYAGNILYRIAPNVVLGFEGAHQQLQYFEGREIFSNRYDATVAYLF